MPRISPRILQWPAAWLESLEGLVFPWACLACDVESAQGPYCPACRDELLSASEGACPRCALPCGPFARFSAATERGRKRGCSWCRGRSLGFDAALALGPYQGPVRDACLRLKTLRGAWLATWLADLLVDAHEPRLLSEVAGGADPWVVPVPLHWRRRHERGYNQAEALARRLATRLRLDLRRPLQRVLPTHHLVDLGRPERAEALKGAFRLRGHGDLKGRTVLLVDDILTTGATCGAAARVLKRAGAARVVVTVIGRAEGTS